jgi:hypothetical protein
LFSRLTKDELRTAVASKPKPEFSTQREKKVTAWLLIKTSRRKYCSFPLPVDGCFLLFFFSFREIVYKLPFMP